MEIICEMLHDNIDLQANETYKRAQSANVHYILRSSEDLDDSQVIQQARKVIVDEFLEMNLQTIAIDECITPRFWRLTAAYLFVKGEIHGENLPDEETSFDYASSSQTMRVSLATVRRYGLAPDLHGAINMQPGDDEPRGVEVMMPQATMTIRKYFRREDFTTKLRNKISYRIGRVNSREFRGYRRGELLFLGATMNRRGDDRRNPWEVCYKFAISEHDDNVEIPGITGALNVRIEKEGWEYIWPRFSVTAQDGYALRPSGIYVEKVYKYADFSEMGLSSNRRI